MRLAALAFVTAVAVAPSALAADPLPVYVTVQGEGSVRLLLAAGNTAPCDSSSNVVIFDGWLEAGSTYAFTSGEPAVCERHTRGVLRQSDWSTDRVRSPPYNRFVRLPWRVDFTIDTRERDDRRRY